MICNYTTKDLSDYSKKVDKIWQRWIGTDSNKHKNIANRFRNPDGTIMQKRAKDRLTDFVQYKLNLPFDSEFILSDKQLRRVEVEIDQYNKDLVGNFSHVVGIVPEGISKQDPTTRRFHLELMDVLNKERVNIGTMENDVAKLTDHMLKAYVESGLQGKYFQFGINAVKDLRKYRRQAMEAPDSASREKFEGEIKKLLDGDQGDYLRQFNDLHNLNNDAFKATLNNPVFRREGEAESRRYNNNVINAVKTSRAYLNKMGKVYVSGLRTLKQVIDLKLPYDQRRANSIKDEIDSAIIRIEAGIKEGGYWPGVHLQNLVDIKIGMEKSLGTRNKVEMDKEFSKLEQVLRDLPSLPDNVKATNPNLNFMWDQDPFTVLNQYGKDAIGFNKLAFSQKAYLEAMKDIPKTNNTQFMKGMKKFITEQYTVFADGLAHRPEWINNLAYGINAFETARTMGFNITGGIKNAASALHYFSTVGPFNLKRIQADIRNNVDGVSDKLNKLEKDAGYRFTDVATELFTEGLIRRKDFDGDIEFNPLTGKITYDGKPLRTMLGDAVDWSVGKMLFFHRMTENWQRRWMFRTAFVNKLQQINKSPLYQTEKGQLKAENFAKNFALWQVNGFAYEYAPVAKNKWVRGDGLVVDETGETLIVSRPKEILGGFSEIALHLMHYPMSLAETHLSALKGIHMSLKARQWDSDEMMYALRYAGVFGFTQLMSIVLNADLNAIFENETLSRIERIHDDLGNYDPGYNVLHEDGQKQIPYPMVSEAAGVEGKDKATFGLLSQVSGPFIGHLKYLTIASGIMNLDESSFNQVVFGNVDYSDDSEDSARYTAYQLSTEYGRWKNKQWPALRDGRGMDLLRHYLNFYPRSWTKRGHEWLFGTPTPKKKQIDPNYQALQVLDLIDQGFTSEEIRGSY